MVFGLAVVLLATACSGGSKKATPTSRPTGTATPTQTPTLVPTPTATPTPYDGDIARFIIPKFGVDAPVESLGVDSTNTMETPVHETTDVGWYHLWTRPGWNGNAVFSAHIYWESVPGPFNKLAQMVDGDQVQIKMNNGAVYTYKVISTNTYSLATIDMGAIITPKNQPAGTQWITMITCAGGTASNGYDYNERNVVVAQRVS